MQRQAVGFNESPFDANFRRGDGMAVLRPCRYDRRSPEGSHTISTFLNADRSLVPAADSFTLFVYGTLMRGGVRHPLLAGQRFLREACTLPLYALFDLGAYPGMVLHEADGRAVAGELYTVGASLLPRLDREEGAPSLYRLEPIEVNGCDEPVFAYLYRQSIEGAPLCPGGRWLQRGGRP
jgi:gamma-glutamylcyclotransferase (GGCT)/AIG2-like uncharacterized protein YtfP